MLPFLLFDPESPFLKGLSAFYLMHQCICCTSCRAEALSVKGVYVHGFTPILSKVRIKLQLTVDISFSLYPIIMLEVIIIANAATTEVRL